MSNRTFKRTTIAAFVAALALGGMSAAFADDHRDDHRGDRHEVQHHDRDRWGNDVDAHRGYGPDHKFYIGHKLPSQYHQHNYVVDDWRGHHLRQPPRGYHWVQQGDDYLLVAVATGLIASAIINGN